MAVASFASVDNVTICEGNLTIERLSPWLYKVVEADPYGQLPFMFAIKGHDKIVVIDTGTGAGSSIREFLDKHINAKGLPYTILLSHNHFDHVGGAHGFSGSEICMGDLNRTYSTNLAVTSLAAGVGAHVKHFEVTRWLGDGDEIWLDDRAATQSGWNRLRILHIPGHALDHIAVLYERERRLFVGDTLYPFTAIDLCNMGSNLAAYKTTLGLIRDLAVEQSALPLPTRPDDAAAFEPSPAEAGSLELAARGAGDAAGVAASKADAEATAAAGSKGETETMAAAASKAEVEAKAASACGELSGRQAKVRELVEGWIGQSQEEAAASFDAWALLSSHGWDVAAAMEAFQTYGEAIGDVVPPGSYAMPKTDEEVRRQFGLDTDPAATGSPLESASGVELACNLPVPASAAVFDGSGGGQGYALTLGCGHVDAALDAIQAVDEAVATLEAIEAGSLPPVSIDKSYGSAEYRSATLAFVMPYPLPKAPTA